MFFTLPYLIFRVYGLCFKVTGLVFVIKSLFVMVKGHICWVIGLSHLLKSLNFTVKGLIFRLNDLIIMVNIKLFTPFEVSLRNSEAKCKESVSPSTYITQIITLENEKNETVWVTLFSQKMGIKTTNFRNLVWN